MYSVGVHVCVQYCLITTFSSLESKRCNVGILLQLNLPKNNQFIYLFICVFVYLFVCLFIVCLFISSFVYLFIYLFIFLEGVDLTLKVDYSPFSHRFLDSSG